MVSVSPSWPCSTSTLTSSRHSPGRLTPFATSSLITATTNKSNIWAMLLRQTFPRFAANFQTTTTTPMLSSLLQHPHAKTIHECEMHHQGSPAAMGHWSSRWQTSISPFDNIYQHTPFDPWWRMSYPITTYENNSVTSLPNGAWTPSLLMQQMDKSPPDLDSGGSTPIGSMLATSLQDRHLSHYIGHYKTDTTGYTTPSPRRFNRPYTWKTGRLLQSFATNNFSIASPHKLPLTSGDRHQPMHKPTQLHGRDGNKTIMTIPTVAIPTTVSHSPTRRRLATNHPITTRATHGSTRQLHQNYRPTPINSNKKHHVGQCLAFPISTLATHTTTDDSFQPSAPQPTYTVQLTEAHWIVAVIPNTLGTTSKNNTSPTHATTWLAQPP